MSAVRRDRESDEAPPDAAPLRVPKPMQARARAKLRAWVANDRRSQATIGLAIGKTQAWLSRYIAGKFDADLDTLADLSAQFGQTLVALLELPGDPGEAALIEAYRGLSEPSKYLLLALAREMKQAPVTPAPAARRARR